ncbi:hypothetical protein R6G99_05450, partial [Actinotignum timonense]|nr:hypothetical protein [Actinotignum timonense]
MMVVSTTPPPRPAAFFPAPGTYLRAWGRAWERVAAGAGGRIFFEPLTMDDGSVECVPRVELCGAENPQPSWPVAELGRFQRANLALGEFSIHFAFNADIERVLASDWALSARDAASLDSALQQRIPPEWEAGFAPQQLRFHEVALPSRRRTQQPEKCGN